jgi:phospholipid/cholesterol/gamma-HCH transport system substrate-binding protein/paraquat-inducible protein B
MNPKENPPPEISWIPRYPYLPSVQSTGTRLTSYVETILEQIEKMRLDRISEQISGLLGSMDALVKKVDPALSDVKTATTDADGLIKDLRRVVNEDVGKDLKSLIASMKDVVEKDLGPAVRSARATADRLPATFEKIDGTLDRISGTLRRVDRTLAEDQGSMDEALDNLRVATGDLRELMAQVKRYPTQALFGEAPPKKAVDK